MSDIYAVTGASGNTGSVIAEQLLAAGKEVRVVARHPEKLKNLEAKGAKVFAGDLADTKFVEKAFAGATGVYAMIPPDYSAPDVKKYQETVGNSLVTALALTGVKFVAALSSVGAHLKEGAGIVQALHTFEEKLNALDANVLILRPGYFMENLFWQIPTIKQMGIIGSPLRGDLKIGMVATRDIADVAARHLLKKDFSGKKVQYILGSRDVTYSDVAQALGKAISKPDLKYVQFPYEDAEKAMQQGGLSPSSAAAMIQLNRVMNDGAALNASVRDASSTTPTSIEDFAKIFAGAFSAS